MRARHVALLIVLTTGCVPAQYLVSPRHPSRQPRTPHDGRPEPIDARLGSRVIAPEMLTGRGIVLIPIPIGPTLPTLARTPE